MWPKPYRCAVCITVDVDLEYAWSKDAQMFESNWRGRSLMRWGLRHVLGASLTTQSQGEFGRRVGLNRILALLDRYNIKGTFFVPGVHAETFPAMVRGLVERGHEVGHHGYKHESPLYFIGDVRQERRLICKAADALERAAGVRPVGYRGPGFDLTRQTLRILGDEGFQYDSSLMADEKPYRVATGAGDRSIVELPVDWCLDDFPHFAFMKPPLSLGGLSPASHVLDGWISEFKGYYEEQGCFTLTLHPSIIGRHYRIEIFERLIAEMQRHDGVWFARCQDVAEHWARVSPSSLS